MSFRLVGCAVAAMLVGSPSVAAELLTNGSGQLIGARGVEIGTSVYDVSFVEGSCVSVFLGCDETDDFAFGSSVQASEAAQALLDQVFTGAFDSSPQLTLGCSDLLLCAAEIPYLVGVGNVSVVETLNFAPSALEADSFRAEAFPRTLDSAQFSRVTWAVFSPSIAAIPEPATWAMMILGFGAIGSTLRRGQSHRAVRQTVAG